MKLYTLVLILKDERFVSVFQSNDNFQGGYFAELNDEDVGSDLHKLVIATIGFDPYQDGPIPIATYVEINPVSENIPIFGNHRPWEVLKPVNQRARMQAYDACLIRRGTWDATLRYANGEIVDEEITEYKDAEECKAMVDLYDETMTELAPNDPTPTMVARGSHGSLEFNAITGVVTKYEPVDGSREYEGIYMLDIREFIRFWEENFKDKPLPTEIDIVDIGLYNSDNSPDHRYEGPETEHRKFIYGLITEEEFFKTKSS